MCSAYGDPLWSYWQYCQLLSSSAPQLKRCLFVVLMRDCAVWASGAVGSRRPSADASSCVEGQSPQPRPRGRRPTPAVAATHSLSILRPGLEPAWPILCFFIHANAPPLVA